MTAQPNGQRQSRRVHGSQGTPSRPVKWLTREKDGPWLSCFNLSAYGRARRTETAKTTRRHPQLDAEKARSLELKAAELDSLLFPAPVGREFAPDSRNSYAISDVYIASGSGKSRVSGDFPAKLPEARDFPLSGRPVWLDCVRHHPVLPNHGGFPVLENAREFNGLSD
jgi:hypothetical protein